jgi:glycosyltransferase involved in cell wall biosynthesis
MKVCILSSAHAWNDNRIYKKEAKSLAMNYKVILHARANFVFKRSGGINIHGLTAVRLARLRNLCILTWRAYRTKCAIFHIHDFELLPLALLLKISKHARVIYDIHENFTAAAAVRPFGSLSMRRAISRVVATFERFAISHMDGCIIAENSYASHVQPYARRMVQVLNYPRPVKTHRNNGQHPGLNLIYSGVVTEPRGAFYLIDFMFYLTRLGMSDCALHIVGRYFGHSLLDKMRKYAYKLEIAKQVNFRMSTDQVDYEIIENAYASMDVGLVLLQDFPHYRESLPTKFYEYMHHHLLVVASDFPLWKSFIKEYSCGIAVPSNDARKAAAVFWHALKKLDIKQIGNKNSRIARGKFTWNSQADLLLKLYKTILK